MKKTLYYSDEVNDDFANTNIKNKKLPKNFKFFRNDILFKIKKLIIYRVIVTPLVFFYSKFIARMSFKNKKVLKEYKNRGCFLYGNHTTYANDAFKPSLISFPRAADIIVNSDATSIKGIAGLVVALGAIPIPDNFRQLAQFNNAIEQAICAKHWVAIYPEAHIWPYYTGIRNFSSVSFKYPIKCDAPVFSFTTVYTKRKFFKKPKTTVYIDGPFFADKSLPQKQAAQKLRNEVYAAMQNRSKLSNYSYIEYVYKPKDEIDINEEVAVESASKI